MVSSKPLRRDLGGEIDGPHLDVLPNIGFGIDDTHVWLICATIHEGAIIHLKKRVSGIVLKHVGDLKT